MYATIFIFYQIVVATSPPIKPTKTLFAAIYAEMP